MSNLNKFDMPGQTHVFTSFPETHQEENDTDTFSNSDDQKQQLLNQSDQDSFLSDKKYSVWQIEYYQRFFNVNTTDVLARIIGSMTPSFNQSFLLNKIRPNPDLYGPFWISITLIFTIAISGNLYSFVENFGTPFTWHTDFHKITSSAATIIAYWWLVPTLVYILMSWRQTRADFEFIELLCVYGYSLSIYVPVAILWLIHIPVFQWVLVLIAVLLSGSVLLLTFWPAFSQDNNKQVSVIIMASILGLHALLGIGFMLFFFHDTNDHPPNITTTTISTMASSKLNEAITQANSSIASVVTKALNN